MLKRSLITRTSPQAYEANVVYWRDYRVTVLQNRLFRLEKCDGGQFRDSATQAVWFRDMSPQKYSYCYDEEEAIIDTGACKLILKKKYEDCRVVLNGKTCALDNKDNLKGTYRTLDCCSGDVYLEPWGANDKPKKISLSDGVCSMTGVAVLDDAQSLTLAQNGEIMNERGKGKDDYIFAYGKDYRAAVKALYLITGVTPKIPRFALGNWWSRYHLYTDKEYLAILSGFEERDIPLTVATVDMDWHYSVKIDEEIGITQSGKNSPEYVGTPAVNWGWTGYTWNKNLFPDHKAFLQKLKDKGLKITLNLHPSDGIRYWEDAYEGMAKAMGIDPKTQYQVPFTFTNDKFINAYFDILHHPHEEEGVDFWWLDWQQPNIPWEGGNGDYDPLWALNHYHYLDNAENHSSPLTLSRYAGIGSHRYPLGFSGDTYITWKTLEYLPYFTSTASNVGYTWWSHDIGGHYTGVHDNEMFLRHIQYGVFSPIMRLHCSDNPTTTKEPWIYEGGAGRIAEDYLRIRHSMIPFLYTCSYLTHKEGKALVEPLYYEWTQPQAYEYKTEYLFGGLLVAPVVSHTQKDGFARVKMWIPEGSWTDIFTGDHYEMPEGGKEVVLLRRLESIPVLAKAGTILPFSMDKGNGSDNPQKLAIHVYKGNGAYTLYEDGSAQKHAGEVFTSFTAIKENGKQSLTIKAEGSGKIFPNNRVLRVIFKDITEGKVTVYCNGIKMVTPEIYLENVAVEFPVEIDKEYRVDVLYTPRDALGKLIARAQQVILRAEEIFEEKSKLFKQCQGAKSVAEYKTVVEESTMSTATKLRLLETLQ